MCDWSLELFAHIVVNIESVLPFPSQRAKIYIYSYDCCVLANSLFFSCRPNTHRSRRAHSPPLRISTKHTHTHSHDVHAEHMWPAAAGAWVGSQLDLPPDTTINPALVALGPYGFDSVRVWLCCAFYAIVCVHLGYIYILQLRQFSYPINVINKSSAPHITHTNRRPFVYTYLTLFVWFSLRTCSSLRRRSFSSNSIVIIDHRNTHTQQ